MKEDIPQEIWLENFDLKIKNGKYDKFSLLLCDLDGCEAEQATLLRRILFEDHVSCTHWFAYITYAKNKYSSKKCQLQRLINKAFDCIQEVSLNYTLAYLLTYLLTY